MKKTLLLLLVLFPAAFTAQTSSRYLQRSVHDTDLAYARKLAREAVSPEISFGLSASVSDYQPQRPKQEGSEPASPEAIQKREKKLRNKPSDAPLLNEIGQMWKRLNQSRKALDYFIRAKDAVLQLMADEPGKKEWLEAAAMIFVNMENYTEAITYLEELRLRDPDNPLISSFLPLCYMATNNPGAGMHVFDTTLAHNPGNIMASMMKTIWTISELMPQLDSSAITRFRNKKPEEMIDLSAARKAMELYKDDYRYQLVYQHFRALCLLLKLMPGASAGQRPLFHPDSTDQLVIAELEAFFRAGIARKDFENKFLLYKSLGMMLAFQDKLGEAKKQFIKALEYKPVSRSTVMDHAGEVYDNIAFCDLFLRDTAAAEQVLRNKIKIAPAVDPAAADYIVLARFRLYRGDVEETRTLCTKAIELDPKSDQPHLILAAASITAGDYANAQQELDLAFTINRDNTNAMLLFGLLEFARKNFDNAYIAFESVLRSGPGNEPARSMFKRYYIKKKN